MKALSTLATATIVAVVADLVVVFGDYTVVAEIGDNYSRLVWTML